jgi:hypothetical protein
VIADRLAKPEDGWQPFVTHAWSTWPFLGSVSASG